MLASVTETGEILEKVGIGDCVNGVFGQSAASLRFCCRPFFSEHSPGTSWCNVISRRSPARHNPQYRQISFSAESRTVALLAWAVRPSFPAK